MKKTAPLFISETTISDIVVINSSGLVVNRTIK